MYNKFFSPLVIIITIGTLSFVCASSMLFDVQSKEAMAQTTDQSKNRSNSINFLTYENPIFGIRMLYPANWDKQENTNSSNKNSTLTDLVTFGPQSNNRSDIAGKLIVKVDNISDIKPITLSENANDIIRDLRQDFKVAESTTTLAGLPTYKFEYTGTEESADLQAMLLLTIKGDRAYIISYTADPARYSSYLPTVRLILFK